jgi:hypothetical protein
VASLQPEAAREVDFQGDLDVTIAVPSSCRATTPERIHAMWTACMRVGDFAGAWAASDAARHRPSACATTVPRHLQAVWDGSAIDGRRVLVRCYHGLGDTIQFARYFRLLKARSREVIVWAQPTLVPLLATMPEIDRLLPLHDGSPEVEYDVDVESMELPYLFRTTIETIPRAIPYLHPDRADISRPRGPAVGLVWRAGDWDLERSIPFVALASLLTLPITWYVLQAGAGRNECPDDFGTPATVSDPLSTARLIAALDLVITIDSMPAHLSGALGTPTWTLLPRDADWRWMQARDDTPWYPTMRLFRQERRGEWAPVIERVASCLSDWARPQHGVTSS